MVCTLHKNTFRPSKCSNFQWYEGKLQISRQTRLQLLEKVVSIEPMNQNLPFNNLMHKFGKIQISVAASVLNCTSCSRFLSSPLMWPKQTEISFQVLNRTSDCHVQILHFTQAFITSLVTNKKNTVPNKTQCSSF